MPQPPLTVSLACESPAPSLLPVWIALSTGFTPGARELFKQENHLALYQLPSGEKAKESAQRRPHHVTKRQPPISHLVSLFVRDRTTGERLLLPSACLSSPRDEPAGSFPFLLPHADNVQMLSHGSADLILEACTDFWDGADIYPLSGSDR